MPMDVSAEAMESLLWLATAFVVTLGAVTLVVAALVRWSGWGRQFWSLSGDYFSLARSRRTLLALAVILLITLAGVRVDVLFSSWYNRMYSALQELDVSRFWLEMGVFAVLAVIHVARSLLDYYLNQRFALHWRAWLNERLLSRWLAGDAYYRSLYADQGVDNPDQRIQQDVELFVNSSLELSMGVVNAVVATVAFTLILWGLSGPLAVLGVEIPRGMVFAVYLYVLTATVLAAWIGRPLVRLNFLNERLSASYRYALVRLREYGESIAFYGGRGVEGQLLRGRFAEIITNAWRIVHRTLKFSGFNLSASQAAVVFPFLVQAPRYFAKQISLGDMVQTAQAFNTLQGKLSFFRDAYDKFAAYRATLERLSGFLATTQAVEALPVPALEEGGKALCLEDLTLYRPDGQVLAAHLTLNLAQGEALLIQGPSGAGKTTLLRTLAGLWPYSQGRIRRPAKVLFLAQKPYLPLGSLRAALFYPAPIPPEGGDEEALAALRGVALGHLVARLDDVADWAQILSLGEQQRLAFGRLLLARPAAAFLDEATSAMDEGLEDTLYRLVRAHLPYTILVSVGHRSTLRAYHGQYLTLLGEGGGWQMQGEGSGRQPG